MKSPIAAAVLFVAAVSAQNTPLTSPVTPSPTPICIGTRRSTDPGADTILSALASASAVANACDNNKYSVVTNYGTETMYYGFGSYYFNMTKSLVNGNAPSCANTFNNIIESCIGTIAPLYWGGWVVAGGVNFSLTDFAWPKNALSLSSTISGSTQTISPTSSAKSQPSSTSTNLASNMGNSSSSLPRPATGSSTLARSSVGSSALVNSSRSSSSLSSGLQRSSMGSSTLGGSSIGSSVLANSSLGILAVTSSTLKTLNVGNASVISNSSTSRGVLIVGQSTSQDPPHILSNSTKSLLSATSSQSQALNASTNTTAVSIEGAGGIAGGRNTTSHVQSSSSTRLYGTSTKLSANQSTSISTTAAPGSTVTSLASSTTAPSSTDLAALLAAFAIPSTTIAAAGPVASHDASILGVMLLDLGIDAAGLTALFEEAGRPGLSKYTSEISAVESKFLGIFYDMGGTASQLTSSCTGGGLIGLFNKIRCAASELGSFEGGLAVAAEAAALPEEAEILGFVAAAVAVGALGDMLIKEAETGEDDATTETEPSETETSSETSTESEASTEKSESKPSTGSKPSTEISTSIRTTSTFTSRSSSSSTSSFPNYSTENYTELQATVEPAAAISAAASQVVLLLEQVGLYFDSNSSDNSSTMSTSASRSSFSSTSSILNSTRPASTSRSSSSSFLNSTRPASTSRSSSSSTSSFPSYPTETDIIEIAQNVSDPAAISAAIKNVQALLLSVGLGLDTNISANASANISVTYKTSSTAFLPSPTPTAAPTCSEKSATPGGAFYSPSTWCACVSVNGVYQTPCDYATTPGPSDTVIVKPTTLSCDLASASSGLYVPSAWCQCPSDSKLYPTPTEPAGNAACQMSTVPVTTVMPTSETTTTYGLYMAYQTYLVNPPPPKMPHEFDQYIIWSYTDLQDLNLCSPGFSEVYLTTAAKATPPVPTQTLTNMQPSGTSGPTCNWDPDNRAGILTCSGGNEPTTSFSCTVPTETPGSCLPEEDESGLDIVSSYIDPVVQCDWAYTATYTISTATPPTTPSSSSSPSPSPKPCIDGYQNPNEQPVLDNCVGGQTTLQDNNPAGSDMGSTFYICSGCPKKSKRFIG